MTQPTTIAFRNFLIEIGDGGSPENFTKASLAMKTRGFTQQLKTTSITVPDETNEDAVVDELKTGDVKSRSATGKGTLGTADVATWQAWFDSGAAKNIRVHLVGTGYWQFPALLTAFNVTGQRTDVTEVDLTFEQSGNSTWTGGA